MLFSPITLGQTQLPNRLVMAPLTRTRSGNDGVPGPLVAEYYSQRSSLGLIVSEGIFPGFSGRSYVGQPGLVTQEQISGWKKATDAVHNNGGRIFAQIMHGGRISHDSLTNGHPVVGPSAIAMDGEVRTFEGKQPFPVPHALTVDEIQVVIEETVQASRNAMEAGFDGVELHAGNGFLMHEFLSPATNTRSDSYGGSPENHARFVMETVEAVSQAIGSDNVGLRLSPENPQHGMAELDDPAAHLIYQVLVESISPLKIAYLSMLHNDPQKGFVQDLRERFNGPFLINTGFDVVTTRAEALSLINDGHADAVVVGRATISNPDLALRWEKDLPLNEADATTFYGEGAHGAAGYTDYPLYQSSTA